MNSEKNEVYNFDVLFTELTYIAKNRISGAPYIGKYYDALVKLNLIDNSGMITKSGIDGANIYQSASYSNKKLLPQLTV